MKSTKTMGNPEVLRLLGDETTARAKVFSEEQKGLECTHSRRMRSIVMARDEVGVREDGESVN
jgi:hypothetical protein